MVERSKSQKTALKQKSLKGNMVADNGLVLQKNSVLKHLTDCFFILHYLSAINGMAVAFFHCSTLIFFERLENENIKVRGENPRSFSILLALPYSGVCCVGVKK